MQLVQPASKVKGVHVELAHVLGVKKTVVVVVIEAESPAASITVRSVNTEPSGSPGLFDLNSINSIDGLDLYCSSPHRYRTNFILWCSSCSRLRKIDAIVQPEKNYSGVLYMVQWPIPLLVVC